jgi:hypothetical protein
MGKPGSSCVSKMVTKQHDKIYQSFGEHRTYRRYEVFGGFPARAKSPRCRRSSRRKTTLS